MRQGSGVRHNVSNKASTATHTTFDRAYLVVVIVPLVVVVDVASTVVVVKVPVEAVMVLVT